MTAEDVLDDAAQPRCEECGTPLREGPGPGYRCASCQLNYMPPRSVIDYTRQE